MQNRMSTNKCVAECTSKIKQLTNEIESLKLELGHTTKSLAKSVTDCSELKVSVRRIRTT